ncbi:type III restriction protein res subunit [Paenibacillus curdlanolyticus YK9]|uniref:DNA 3'-5' helicase n=1 Tax=Paenibacillus curdlanolyticus YK9 TaxID=717606 RepID=E0I3R8_9BACL|nr:type III restriction protein res subunit [Paenibacillus curdlanolyticus YK9]
MHTASVNASTPKPLIVLADLTVLLDERMQESQAAREALSRFADLEKSPSFIHTYRISPLSLWNAASSGIAANVVLDTLARFNRYHVPKGVEDRIRELMERFGRLRLDRCANDKLRLTGDEALLAAIRLEPSIQACLESNGNQSGLSVRGDRRGAIKRELTRLGYPVIDCAGYRMGELLAVTLRSKTKNGSPFVLRDYQHEAVERFHEEGTVAGGSGVMVLPCGAGKTIIGIGAVARLQCATLIVTSSLTSVQQWKSELLDKTTLEEEAIGEYSSQSKQVRPITIATYNMLATGGGAEGEYRHMALFNERDWGLIIYDEVHMLPAPVFRLTAELQATRRLGLTATLIREDGRETDVFSLIGPKRYELPWKELERQGQIAELRCEEVRVPLPDGVAHSYWTSDARTRTRMAAENPNKTAVVRQLLERHRDKPALVIGAYLSQLKQIAASLDAPLLTGEMAHNERTHIYESFRRGEHPVLVVSKIANFAVDLPDAAIAVQVSGTFGSRQEEAQRIGRLLRPKKEHNEAVFYTLVSEGTKEVDYAMKRQQFMTEQGYRYGMSAVQIGEEGRT